MNQVTSKTVRVKNLTSRNRRTAYAFLLPNLIGFLVFTFVPIIVAFGLSFVKWDFSNPMIFVGLKNFMKLFRDDGFQISFWNTIYYTAVSVPVTMMLSLILAILLNQKLKGVKLFRTIFFLPLYFIYGRGSGRLEYAFSSYNGSNQ